MKAEKTEQSPITGKNSVLVEDVNGIESKICMDSGYMTTGDFKFENTKKLEAYEGSMPQLIIDNRFKDEDLGQWWYLTTVQFRTGMIYPQPCKHDLYEWAFTPVIQLDSDEQKQYPVPGKDNEYYESRLATEHTELYQKYDFKGACKRAGAVVDVAAK
tara:strand:+ start:2536 stop:3009 length:474 start_codon:yes stop_codon:yes gene_type:complete